ncbi:MAG: segregation and condensation protein B [Parcubacteria group bacterium GW2011_GWC2_42_12]|uniref:SMC-Scp complex subunit ScpB n=2 Tax=Candidatus Falkowiibacteriota TaxID=1752728 RepID=A0A1F5S9Z4_9BACT|nr:MAG: segregation and condensation protein B [Candidatus Falkowbacteria bacterium GW2011_GWA2_41_14]KKS33362.1 MAG: segregation and condensation protein B [Parcubacteria group bacterium GW2011_GWC2_42_12]OGF23382.1 MAG: SMC-Scp complex subunit ScpB [Candidatus Falkowbacteria bacterium RIFCSPHIGHO2_02_FULL_42_9]
MSIKSKIESLLFISAKPMTVNQLADLLKADLPAGQAGKKEIIKSTGELLLNYKNNRQGVQIINDGAKYQMVSSPANAKVIQEFIKDETTGELSKPSLEALTIIAYRGPVAKIDLDRIRGVNCALILRNLLIRGLIEGKFDKKKNETYYTVTFDFIRFLGLNKINDLPDYVRLHQDETIDRMLAANENSEVV